MHASVFNISQLSSNQFESQIVTPNKKINTITRQEASYSDLRMTAIHTNLTIMSPISDLLLATSKLHVYHLMMYRVHL